MAIGPGVAVGVSVGVRVAVGVAVGVLVGVGVSVAVAVAVSVGRGASVSLGRGVGGVGVSVGSAASAPRSGVGSAIGAQPARRIHARPVRTTTMDGRWERRIGTWKRPSSLGMGPIVAPAQVAVKDSIISRQERISVAGFA